ncbi:MAG: DUF1289 domain-containing protein [Pseudohongiellaceae bacterium]|nr:DUF1289 domain-containing protein [Pseudohongiellaceae bacterium]
MKSSTTRTPCIGVCSTTSLGDPVCRGCQRYAVEVIQWNAYTGPEKEAVLRRISTLTEQILRDKFIIVDEEKLAQQLQRSRLPFNEALSPFCWIQTLLKRIPLQALNLENYGVAIARSYQDMGLQALADQVDEELLVLAEAHHARYFSAHGV